jgi:hypothetical protein
MELTALLPHPKEVVLRILVAIKNHRPRTALNPRTLVPRASTLSNRTLRPTASIIRANIETVHTSETEVFSKETARRYIPEDLKLHTRRRENLKPYRKYVVSDCRIIQPPTAANGEAES